MCGAKESHLIVPLIVTFLAVLASTVKMPPLPDFSNLTVPEPVTCPPFTVKQFSPILPLPARAFGLHAE